MRDDWYKEIPLEVDEEKGLWGGIQRLYWDYYSKPPDYEDYWIFRGEKNFDKKQEKYLCTSLEKAFDDYGICDKNKKVKYEKRIIRKFQRKASLYIDNEPDKDDILEWLALMRHHGAPARLMDWNYSFYIAVYFALAENADGGVVWALNAAKINKPELVINQIPKGQGGRFWQFCHKFESKEDVLGIRGEGDKLKDLAITCYLIENPFPLVYAVNPFRLNKRLTIQHGLFLLTGDIREPFKENLNSSFKNKNDIHKITIECDKKERNEILRHLRNMNINNEVLFPGLDGFAKSTGEFLAYPEATKAKTK